jgi:hypothetical protein
MDTPLSFRNFLVREEAEAMAELLRNGGLRATFQDNSSLQDPLFSGSVLPSFHVLLPSAEFEKAEVLLTQKMGTGTDDVPVDHYLNEFSDKELMDILMSSDEWSAMDLGYAKRLLQQRGKVVPEELILAARDSRLRMLRAPAPSQTAFIVLGYASALLGGLLGIAIGWYINTAKKTLPNGEQIPLYNAKDRKHAARLFWIGVVVALGLLTYRVAIILSRYWVHQ